MAEENSLRPPFFPYAEYGPLSQPFSSVHSALLILSLIYHTLPLSSPHLDLSPGIGVCVCVGTE